MRLAFWRQKAGRARQPSNARREDDIPAPVNHGIAESARIGHDRQMRYPSSTIRSLMARGMGRSRAESTYRAWATAANRQAVTPFARATGEFDAFRRTGFDGIVTSLLKHQRRFGSRETAEQVWKLLDKLARRNGEIVAREAMKVLQADALLNRILSEFPASMFPKLSNDARELAIKLDPTVVVFPKTGKRVHLRQMLGEGSMSSGVFLGDDQNGQHYAVKHIARSTQGVRGFGGSTARDRLTKVDHYLAKYSEAALTPHCLDVLIAGRDEYLLLELSEGSIDYSTLNLSDILCAFDDLRKSYAFSRYYMADDVAQDVGVLHVDIHGENLARFDGKLTLIDYGLALVFSE